MSKQQKKSQKLAALPPKPLGGMALASTWLIHEVLIAPTWNEQGHLALILVARRSPTSGKIAAGSFLVDLACLGVKSAQYKFYKTATEYNAEIRRHTLRIQPLVPASFDLAAKIIMTGLDYAESLGFKPDPIFTQAQYLLGGANPLAEATPVPTGGPEGKPLFVNGPYDNVAKIMAQLQNSVGEGNFHYMIRTSEDGPVITDEGFTQVSNPPQIIDQAETDASPSKDAV